MQIVQVRLDAAAEHTEALRRFYADQLGLPAVGGDGSYGFKAGTSIIEFNPISSGQPFYHYALRVPRNRYESARDWLADHAELLVDEDSGETTFAFDNWNADACYAHDPCRNIIELIALKGAIIGVTSSGGLPVVLVDEATEPVAPVDLASAPSRNVCPGTWRDLGCWCRMGAYPT
jgi:hypothetical protein